MRWLAVAGALVALVVAAAWPGTALAAPQGPWPAVASPQAPWDAFARPLPPAAPAVQVLGGELVDLSTGAQLWGKDVNIGRPMGSITKVMTALVVLESGNLDRNIKITKAALRYVRKGGASSAGLVAGDVLTAHQLLEALLLPSGCDAAFMLATAYGPGRSAFIRKMNDTASRIGLTATHFSSFDGMPYPTEHSTWSSPADLIRLGEVAMRNPVFRQIVTQHSYLIRRTSKHHSYFWYNTNRLIGSYRGATGIKTGDTNAAGNCLLFEARRGNRVLIGVVLHASPTRQPSSAITAGAIVLNWGFRRTRAYEPTMLTGLVGPRS
jgi:serine-type D-Ala-D-Ala carboxypeptidase (penicillin-binding protein 5/6)